MTYSYKTLIVDIRDSVAWMTMNRPERLNALNGELATELLDVLERFTEDKSVLTVVLTGAGRAFCSGADIGGGGTIGTVDDGDEQPNRAFAGRHHLKNGLQRIPVAMRALEKPIIAAVNGIAAGGGFDLACAADIRVCAEGAQFTEIFTKRGLFPGTGGCYLLPRLVGTAKAAELIWLASRIDSGEAERIGLVSYVCPDETFDERVHDFAKRFAAGPPIAISLAKASIYRAEHMELPAAMDFFATAESITLTSEDRTEGMKAFAEKREPQFHGR